MISETRSNFRNSLMAMEDSFDFRAPSQYVASMRITPAIMLSKDKSKRCSDTNVPEFDAQDLKFLALITEWFISKCWTCVRNTVLEVII